MQILKHFAMYRPIAAVLLISALAYSASAHITDEEESYRPPLFDCSALSGEFVTGSKTFVTIVAADGVVTFTQVGKAPLTGSCLAPLIADGTYYPRAHANFETFGPAFAVTDCCNVHIKGDTLIFDKSNVTWSRRKR